MFDSGLLFASAAVIPALYGTPKDVDAYPAYTGGKSDSGQADPGNQQPGEYDPQGDVSNSSRGGYTYPPQPVKVPAEGIAGKAEQIEERNELYIAHTAFKAGTFPCAEHEAHGVVRGKEHDKGACDPQKRRLPEACAKGFPDAPFLP